MKQKTEVREYVPTSTYVVRHDGNLICETKFREVARLVARNAKRLEFFKFQATSGQYVNYSGGQPDVECNVEIIGQVR